MLTAGVRKEFDSSPSLAMWRVQLVVELEAELAQQDTSKQRAWLLLTQRSIGASDGIYISHSLSIDAASAKLQLLTAS